MTTMTEKPTKKKTTFRETPATPVAPAVPADTIPAATHELLGNMLRVEVGVEWYSSSKAVSEAQSASMRRPVGATKDGTSISKRLFDSKNPWVQACNESKGAINHYVKNSGITIPEIVVVPLASRGVKAGKKPGVRLIREEDVVEFDAHIQFLAANLRAAVRNLQNNIEEVKAADRNKLHELYCEDDYPTNLVDDVVVSVEYLPGTRVALNLKEVAPEIYARQMTLARVACEEVVHSWAEEFGRNFQNFVLQFADQLSMRLRLDPVEDWKILKDAEVTNVIKHQDDETVPSGHVVISLRRKDKLVITLPGGKTLVPTPTGEYWLDAMPEHDYAVLLRPYETTQKKKLYDSTLANLKEQMEAFRRSAEMFGPHAAAIQAAVDRVGSLFSEVSRDQDTGRLLEELRVSDRSRRDMRQALQAVGQSLGNAVEDVVKVRRRVQDIDLS